MAEVTLPVGQVATFRCDVCHGDLEVHVSTDTAEVTLWCCDTPARWVGTEYPAVVLNLMLNAITQEALR